MEIFPFCKSSFLINISFIKNGDFSPFANLRFLSTLVLSKMKLCTDLQMEKKTADLLQNKLSPYIVKCVANAMFYPRLSVGGILYT